VYRDPAGEKRSRSFARKTDAERFRSTVEADLIRGDWRDPRLGATTVASWAEQWYATSADKRGSTRARLRGILDRHVLPKWGPRRLSTVQHVEVRAWVAELSSTGLAPRTVRKVAQVLGALMGAAVDARLLAASPCERIPLPRADDQEMRFLTPTEVARLADAMDPRYRAFVWTGALGGLRLGELVGLRRRRVDLLRGRLEVAETGVQVGGTITFGPPKTRAGHRMVTLGSAARTALDQHLAERTGPAADALVFTSPDGGVLHPPNWRRRFWEPAVLAAGLEPLRIHDLRHTAISLWLAAGDNPKEVSRRAGHTSVAFTLDRYGHLYDDADERSRDRLDTLMAAAETPQSAVVRELRG